MTVCLTSDIEYRKLLESDAEAYQKIRLEMLHKNPESFGDSYENNLKHDIEFYRKRVTKSYIAGAFHEGVLIGTAGYFGHEGDKVKHKATIWGVYVQPDFRGKRISQKLIENVINECAKLFEQVLINVSAENFPAITIYKSLGFEEYGREPKARIIKGKYYDEVHMAKFLKENK